MTSKVYPFTLPDSGITVYVRGLSPAMIGIDVERSTPKPKPPGQLVDYGDGNKKWEFNYSHPDYPAMLAIWKEEVNFRTFNAVVLRALVKELNDEEKAEVTAVRQEMADIGIELDKSDKLVWWKHIAAGSDNDTNALMEFLATRGEPKQEVVQSIANSFPSDVSG